MLNADLGDGHKPGDTGVAGVVMLLIDGGFDTTTVLSAHSLEWLSEEPGERARLIQKLGTLRDRASSTNSGWPSP